MEYEATIEIDEIVTNTQGAETIVTIHGLHAEVMVDEDNNISVFNVFIGDPKKPRQQDQVCIREYGYIWEWCEDFIKADFYQVKLLEEAEAYFNSPEATYYARAGVAL